MVNTLSALTLIIIEGLKEKSFGILMRMSPGSFRTYSWIARQPFNVRYSIKNGNYEIDGSELGKEYVSKHPKVGESVPSCFKKGSLWPSLILVEKRSHGSGVDLGVYARVFKRDASLVIDLEVGQDIDEAHSLANEFNIPLFAKSWTKTGKLTGVRRLDTVQNS